MEPITHQTDSVKLTIPKCYICSCVAEETVMVGIDPCQHTYLGPNYVLVPRREWDKIVIDAHTLRGFSGDLNTRVSETHAHKE